MVCDDLSLLVDGEWRDVPRSVSVDGVDALTEQVVFALYPTGNTGTVASGNLLLRRREFRIICS